MRFDLPTSWRHGLGVAAKAGDVLRELGCEKTLLVTDRLLLEKGVVAPVTASLEASGILYQVCDEVSGEPSVTLFERLVNELELAAFDSFLAVGGGSVIDTAKGIAVAAEFGGHIRDYAGFDNLPGPLTRMIVAVPTTAGTGSEITEGSVWLDEGAQTKFLILDRRICPKVALTDPEMTRTVPPGVTAQSGVDALAHGIESYLSKDASLATEPFSLQAIRLVAGGLAEAYDDGDNMDARESVQLGATMAMIAGMNAHMGLCHALAMPLAGMYGLPHGRALALVLPHVLEFNARVAPRKVADVFRALGFLAGDLPDQAPGVACYQRMQAFLSDLGLDGRLADFGYREGDIRAIVERTFAAVQYQFNPRKASEQELAELVERMV